MIVIIGNFPVLQTKQYPHIYEGISCLGNLNNISLYHKQVLTLY